MTSRPSPHAVVQRLQDFESAADLSSLTGSSISFWPVIRMILGSRLSRCVVSGSSGMGSVSVGAVLPRLRLEARCFTRSLASLCAVLATPGSPTDEVLAIGFERNYEYDGCCWVERFVDPVLAEAQTRGLSTRKFDFLSAGALGSPRLLEGGPVNALLDLRVAVALAGTVSQEQLPRRSALEAAAAIWNEVSPEVPFPTAAELYRACKIVLGAKAAGTRLVGKGPTLVVMSHFYGLRCLGLISAIKSAGGRVVDIQHGNQGPSHFAYRGWTHVPAGGYSLLPDFFWCSDAASAAGINEWASETDGAHLAIEGGDPWVEYCAGLAAAPRTDGRRILVSVGVDGDDPLREALPALIDEAPETWRWAVRLHPVDRNPMMFRRWARRLPSQRVDPIDVVSQTPLPMMLPSIAAHLTYYSSTVEEAARFGVPSVVLAPAGASMYPHHFETGIAELVPDLSTVIGTLGRLAASGHRPAKEKGPTIGESLETFFSQLDPIRRARRG